MPKNNTLSNSQKGDTIVEVLVALAILGLAFAIAYATASHSLQISQNAQEHSEALQVIDSQVELLRTNSDSSGIFDDTNKFCMSSQGSKIPIPSSECSQTVGGANFNYSIKYTPSVVNTVSQNIFTVTIKWQGIGNLGPQQEQLSYKLHKTEQP